MKRLTMNLTNLESKAFFYSYKKRPINVYEKFIGIFKKTILEHSSVVLLNHDVIRAFTVDITPRQRKLFIDMKLKGGSINDLGRAIGLPNLGCHKYLDSLERIENKFDRIREIFL